MDLKVIDLSLSLSFFSFSLFLSAYLSFSDYLPTYLLNPTDLSVYLSIYLFVYLSPYVFI